MCLEKGSETLEHLFMYSGIDIVFIVSLSADLAGPNTFRDTHCARIDIYTYFLFIKPLFNWPRPFLMISKETMFRDTHCKVYTHISYTRYISYGFVGKNFNITWNPFKYTFLRFRTFWFFSPLRKKHFLLEELIPPPPPRLRTCPQLLGFYAFPTEVGLARPFFMNSKEFLKFKMGKSQNL